MWRAAQVLVPCVMHATVTHGRDVRFDRVALRSHSPPAGGGVAPSSTELDGRLLCGRG